MGKKTKAISFIIVVLVVLAAAGFFALRALEMANAPDPKITAVKLLESLCSGDYKTAAALTEGGGMSFSDEAKTSEGRLMAELIRASRSYSITNSIRTGFRTAEVDVDAACLDPEKLAEGLDGELDAKLRQMVEDAVYSSDIYTPELSYKKAIVSAAYDSVLRERGSHIADYSSRALLTLKLVYDGSEWRVQKNDTLRKVYSAFSVDETADDINAEIFAKAAASPEYVRKQYKIEEGATRGPEPDRSRFGETDDPAEVLALLDTPIAKQLIGGQSLAWDPDIERIPGSLIRYYLDETILVIEWQEVTARAIGTHTEIIVADGSQIRRKLVNDTFDADEYVVSTELAAQTNAVMALSGDFYDLYGRDSGIVVYDREIYRYETEKLDICFVNGSGALILTYRGQFGDISEARKFIEENDVIFSLCFGPVLIDNYQNVTPDYYTLGEVNDTYPRCAIGQLGTGHYLTLNINVRLNTQYIFWATIKDLGEAMMKYGCEKAYALDGGQTATTVINNQLINDVQFGEERPVSDIIYFATAVPEK